MGPESAKVIFCWSYVFRTFCSTDIIIKKLMFVNVIVSSLVKSIVNAFANLFVKLIVNLIVNSIVNFIGTSITNSIVNMASLSHASKELPIA